MKIFAHRGYSGKYPENTMLAFKKAYESGAYGIELDVQETLDGEIVIIHDETLDRTTTGSGYVKDHTLSELLQLEASAAMHEEYPGMRIPTLKEYCEWVSTTPLVTNIELKTSIIYYKNIEEKVAEMIKEYGLEDRVIFSSFNHLSVVKMKQLLPECPAGALVELIDLANAGPYCKNLGFEYYHPDVDLLSKETVENCKENGISINVWTVNDIKVFNKMQEWNIDGVITNYPLEFVKLSK
ncbi:MAG: glycerophosphodiester phosphodiesterase [Coriobacteriales bacterium]|nr:glycerophosphodiester phosphodiesterase [Coriobacteriales bacterium]